MLSLGTQEHWEGDVCCVLQCCAIAVDHKRCVTIAPVQDHKRILAAFLNLQKKSHIFE